MRAVFFYKNFAEILGDLDLVLILFSNDLR